MEARQDRMETDISELKADVADLKVGVAQLQDEYIRLEGRVGEVVGTAYERRIAKRCRSIAGRYLGIRRAKVLHSIDIEARKALGSLINAAIDAGSITDDEAYTLDLADIIIAGGASSQTDHAVIEASETIDDSDVDRARERAAILARAAGQPAAAAVIGKAASAANQERPSQSSAAFVLLAEYYSIADAHRRPVLPVL